MSFDVAVNLSCTQQSSLLGVLVLLPRGGDIGMWCVFGVSLVCLWELMDTVALLMINLSAGSIWIDEISPIGLESTPIKFSCKW